MSNGSDPRNGSSYCYRHRYPHGLHRMCYTFPGRKSDLLVLLLPVIHKYIRLLILLRSTVHSSRHHVGAVLLTLAFYILPYRFNRCSACTEQTEYLTPECIFHGLTPLYLSSFFLYQRICIYELIVLFSILHQGRENKCFFYTIEIFLSRHAPMCNSSHHLKR